MFRNVSSLGLVGLALGVLAVVFIVIVVADSDDGDSALDNGLGKHITWHTLMDGLVLAKQERKPVMLIIHKSWCGACKSLKPKFRESQKIAKLSSKFVMVNTMDDDEPPGDTYKPDGGYVPRLMFIDPNGNLLTDVINEDGNPEYKYYYYDELSIVDSMEKVTVRFPVRNNDMNSNNDAQPDRNTLKSEL